MSAPLLADVVDVDPFSGVHIPTLWIVCIIAFFVFGLAALYLNFLRRAAYDDRAAWNYGVATVLSAVVSGAALVVVLNGIFNALSGLAGLVIVAAVLDLLRPEQQLAGEALLSDDLHNSSGDELERRRSRHQVGTG